MPYPYYPNMSYGNPYYPGAMPDNLAQLRQMQQPAPQQAPQPQAAQSGGNGVIWVQGEEGAKAYMVAAGNSVMLMDSEGSTFYLKSTDQSGMPMPLRVFDYKERTAAQKQGTAGTAAAQVEYVPRSEFDALAAKVEALTAKGGRKAAAAKEAEEHE